MKKILIGLACSVASLGMACAPVAALSLAPCPDDENKAACEEEQAEILRRWEAGEPTVKSVDNEAEVGPTFIAEDNDDSALLWAGKNLLLAGNDIVSSIDVSNGLMFIAGNTLNLTTRGEYGFIAGNIVNFSGTTDRDLFIAGNMVTLEAKADIGRDVFAGANSLVVKTDLNGNLAASAASVVIKDAEITGNVDLTADEIRFEGNVTIDGRLTYNDNATVSGLKSNGVKVASSETYHVEEIDQSVEIVASIYGKLLSIAGLFITMAIICAIFPRIHEKISNSATADAFGKKLAIGFGILIGVPIFAIATLCTVIAAPLSFISIALYVIMIYLAQGFAGIWLGHLIIEKLCKSKGNVYLEAFVGIVILGVLALVPYVGVITGLLGLLLGLGLIIANILPDKNEPAPKGNRGISEGVKVAEAEVTKTAKSKGQTKAKTNKTAKTTKKA